MLALLAMAGATLSACSPTPEPSPTPTAAFASEEEAFAAAEETYRAYNDAVNRQRDGDESVDPLDYLTGEMLDSEIASIRELEASGITLEGDTKIMSFTGTEAQTDHDVAAVDALVCLDITNARAIDATGVDVTAVGRSDVYGISVTFTGNPDHLLISEYEVVADTQC